MVDTVGKDRFHFRIESFRQGIERPDRAEVRMMPVADLQILSFPDADAQFIFARIRIISADRRIVRYFFQDLPPDRAFLPLQDRGKFDQDRGQLADGGELIRGIPAGNRAHIAVG